MKRIKFFWSMIAVVLTAVILLPSTSCGDDDPDPMLLLSGLDADFPSGEGSLQTAQELIIKCNVEWAVTISYDGFANEDWLAISNRDGSGDATIKVYPKSENNSENARSATLTVTAGSLQKTKKVTQAAGINGKLFVTPNEIVVLSNGFACDWNYGNDVMYYYSKCYLATELERKTDKEIIQDMSSDSDNRDTPSDGYVTSWNRNASTKYVICTVGYDRSGKSGGLMKYEVTTKKGTNQAIASISDVEYNDTYWYWRTSPNGFVTKYYQWFVTSSSLHSTPDATIAWFFKKYMKENPDDFPPIVKDDTWQRARNGGTIFDVVTWAVDVEGNFSGMIDRFSGQISSSSAQMVPSIVVPDNSKPQKTLKTDLY